MRPGFDTEVNFLKEPNPIGSAPVSLTNFHVFGSHLFVYSLVFLVFWLKDQRLKINNVLKIMFNFKTYTFSSKLLFVLSVELRKFHYVLCTYWDYASPLSSEF